jgi:hypothetical protein
MRPQVVPNGKIVSPHGAIPFNNGEIGRVRAASAEILATWHPGFPEVLITKRFETTSIDCGKRPFDRGDKYIDDWLGSQAHDRRASEVLDYFAGPQRPRCAFFALTTRFSRSASYPEIGGSTFE